MTQFKPKALTLTHSKIYDLGLLDCKFILTMNDIGGELIQVKFLPTNYKAPILFGRFDIDAFLNAVWDFENERVQFLNRNYPDYAKESLNG